MSSRLNSSVVVHDRIARVERMMPGYKVIISTPYNINSTYYPTRQREMEACAKVKAEQLKAGVDCKVLLLKDGAWVLRSAKGWKEVGSLSLAGESNQGLHCPLCQYGPYKHARALRLHRCLHLPQVRHGRRIMRGRLSDEQINQAVEAAKKQTA